MADDFDAKLQQLADQFASGLILEDEFQQRMLELQQASGTENVEASATATATPATAEARFAPDLFLPQYVAECPFAWSFLHF